MLKVSILPSLLAADMGRLADGARLAEWAEADALHVDIMDGHFVPNLSMGPATVAMFRREATIPLSVHLMLDNPEHYLDRFIEAGSTRLLIHVEVSCDLHTALKAIRMRGVVPGLTLNPDTPANTLVPYLADIGEVLCMTVHPGYGGQAFIPSVLPKIRQIREMAIQCGYPNLDIMVDGGIDIDTATQCASQGANAFVAGTSLYRVPDMKAAIRTMRDAVRHAGGEWGLDHG
ncbi:MAG: ribulose-phosphate 3-epimerase [Lentisphaerae bacterium RIFOXYA12_FULL_60_10]|nr:MAG: ribulose-phosphate 3-epimerase [Lentisphaerae bacterium RIFOXYA12_FULL_60_10]